MKIGIAAELAEAMERSCSPMLVLVNGAKIVSARLTARLHALNAGERGALYDPAPPQLRGG